MWLCIQTWHTASFCAFYLKITGIVWINFCSKVVDVIIKVMTGVERRDWSSEGRWAWFVCVVAFNYCEAEKVDCGERASCGETGMCACDLHYTGTPPHCTGLSVCLSVGLLASPP